MKIKRRNFWAVLLIAVIFATLAFVSVGCASGTTHYVNPGESIQAAVNAADPYDTIIVRDGTYTENVNVNKRLTIQSENGFENCIAQAANYKDHVFDVTVDYVNISGFTVVGASYPINTAGIYLASGVDHCIISSNNVFNNHNGIYLDSSSENTITGNTISNNDWRGIYLRYSNNNAITDNNASTNGWGIFLWKSSYNNLTTNKATNNNYGFDLTGASNNIIADNNVSNNAFFGMDISGNKNSITGNNASYNKFGIYLSFSDYNTITDNNVSYNNNSGISLEHSGSNTLRDNRMLGNRYNFGARGYYYSDLNNDIDTSNYVDEKPIFYLVGASDIHIDSSSNAGTVYCINCDNVTIRDLTFTDNAEGIFFYNTRNSNIQNDILINNRDNGIHLYESNNNTISGNIASNNNDCGILLEYSKANTITDNNVSNHYCGIELHFSSNNNTISGNIATNNDPYGICLLSSCSKNTISDNIATNNNDYGICILYSCNENTITGNNVSNNKDGISLDSSSGNIITGNNVSKNSDNGIYLYESTNNNTIYLNNLINNNQNACSVDSTNIWNSTEKITYTYKGTTYKNYTGNNWDDYIFEGNDTNSDGIGDTPYSIDSDKDNYPLMEPWENYFAPTENIFDTEAPANPYPSIMGTHKGEIKPSDNINVSKLYTYPCPGTGGHTESIKLYENGELIASGIWNGYQSDYHNITITPSVTLLTGNTYNYTIVTGSYPQIIHEPSKEVTGGTITCSSFVDANGAHPKISIR